MSNIFQELDQEIWWMSWGPFWPC